MERSGGGPGRRDKREEKRRCQAGARAPGFVLCLRLIPGCTDPER